MCYPLYMIPQKRVPEPMNVRFALHCTQRIKLIASRYHLTASDVVRAAVQEKLAEWERSDVLVLRPIGAPAEEDRQ